MKHNIKHKFNSVATVMLLLAALINASACSPTFDDDSKSILMKPEIIAITLDPPEAAPGATVKASFLAADQFGVISEAPVNGGLLQLWMLAEPGASAFASGAANNGSLDSANVDGDSETTDAAMPDMQNIGIMPVFSFDTYPGSDYTFNQAGLAPQLLTLIFFPQGVDPAELQTEDIADKIQEMMDSGQAQLALRTLVVSNRSDTNRNPRITAASAAIKDAVPQDLTFLTNDSDNIPAARAEAAANPFEVKYEKNLRLHFTITVEDEGDLEDALLYQWISNAGEFKQLPTAERDLIVPEYIEPIGDFSDQSELDSVDPRTDPNLHAVWVIVRDNGVENQLGQSWIEFYIRVKK